MPVTKKKKPKPPPSVAGRRPHQPIRVPGEGEYIPPPTGPTAPGAPPPPMLDLGIPGLPPDIAAKVDAILRDGAPNGPERALAYIRTTPWYATAYKGIGAGIQKGVIGSEADYRAYVNQANQWYRQYYGRDATGEEIESFLTLGYTPTTIQQIGAGKAYIDANRGDIQHLGGAFTEGGQFTQEELTAYGEQKAGRGSTLGATIQTKVETALQKMQRVFEGQLATSPGLEQSLGQQVQRKRKPDISA